MALKDDGGETISKAVLDWLTRVGAIATILATILGLFVSEDNAKKIAFIAAGVLAIGSGVIYFYQRHRAARLKIAESLEPLAPSATLRGLLPFEEGDQLPGRARDIQELYTLVASSSFRFGVLWGESGCGKTSLLRAGLVPKLRNEKFLPLYINKPTNNPQEAIRSALLKEVLSLEKQTNKSLKQLLGSAAPKGKKIAILFDQFEEFFLTNRTPKSRAGFIKWLGETIAEESVPVVFLIGIRADFFAQLQSFAPQIPEPTSIRTTYQLQNFDTEQAKQIFSAAAKADGIPFEPELIQAVIRELETEEFIRPAELQVVGTRLKRKNVFTLNKYETLGGAKGILSSYISEEIKQSANEQVTRLVLRLMCANIGETKSQTDLSMEDILRGISGAESAANQTLSNRPEVIQLILNQFVAARVLIHTEDDKYNLIHDYLAPYVRTATEGTETNTERANQLLKRYVAEYKEEPKTRIPFHRIRLLQKYASTEIKGSEKAKELIKKSKLAFYRIVSVPFIIIASIYLFLANSYYFSTDGLDIVIRSGNPLFKFVPGTGNVVIDTGFKESQADEQLVREKIGGFWFERGERDYLKWGEQLSSSLNGYSGTQALRWLDRSSFFSPDEDSLQIIALTNPQSITPDIVQKEVSLLNDTDSNVRSSAAAALGAIAKINPQSITPDIVQKLVNLLDDSEYGNVLTNGAKALGSIAQVSPQSITPDIVQKLINLIDVGNDYPDVLPSAENSLKIIAQVNPQSITPDIVQKQANLLDDSNPNYVRFPAAATLGEIAQACPASMIPDIIEKLENLLNEGNSYGSTVVATTLAAFAQVDPQIITPNITQKLGTLLGNTDPYVRSDIANILGTIAQSSPQSITPDIVQKLVNLLYDSDSGVRSSAITALGSIAQASPQNITPDVVENLDNLLDNINYGVRSSVLATLRSIAKASPQSITSSTVQKLADLLENGDSSIRSKAATTLVPIAQANPQSITPDIVQRLINLLNDSNYEVFSSAQISLPLIAKASPQGISPSIIQKLGTRLDDSDYIARWRATTALTAIAQGVPQSITPDIVQKLVKMLDDESESDYVRASAAMALGAIALARPQSISQNIEPDIVQNLLSYPDSEVNSMAATALGSMAKAYPQSITPDTVQKLVNLLHETNWNGRSSKVEDSLQIIAQVSPQNITPDIVQQLVNLLAESDYPWGASVLGSIAQTNPQSITPDIMQSLIILLKDGRNAKGRDNASYAVFEIALKNSDQEEIIREELEQLRSSSQPHWRIAASQTLEMITIGDLVKQAHDHPEQTEHIKSGLNYLINLDDSLNEEHLSFAASSTLTEIGKVEAEKSSFSSRLSSPPATGIPFHPASIQINSVPVSLRPAPHEQSAF